MSKYNVGDRVRIVSLEKFLTCKYRASNGEMDHWAGKVMTIRKVYRDEYYMQEDIDVEVHNHFSGWVWDDSMIEGLAYTEIDIDKDDLMEFLK